MAQLNAGIILGGQSPDIMGSFDRGQQTGARQNAIGQQNALAQLYQTQGAGIASGDQNALNALAQIDPMASLGVQGQRQGMQATQQRMDMLSREEQRQIQSHAAQLSAAERAAEAQRIEQSVAMGLAAQSPQEWDAMMQQTAPDLVGQFDNRSALANRFMSIADILKRQDGADPTTGMREYQFAQSQGFQGSFADWKESGRASTNVTVNTGEGEQNRYLYGSDAGLPAGWQLDRETGQASPIPGGPAAMDVQGDIDSRGRQEALTARQLNPTIDDIVTARDLAETGIGRTGMMSNILSRVPGFGQGAVDLGETVDAIGAGISLENLNQMRQASPTGGALGNVSDKQSALLSSAFGSLNQNQSKPLFLYNLARVENTLNDIVHGEGNGPARHDMEAMRRALRGDARGQVEILEQGSAPQQGRPGAPPVGTVMNGYRFKGGDPANQSSWEAVR